MQFDRRTLFRAGVGLAGAGLLGRQALASEMADLPPALIAAAKKEGQLNVITLPRDWANYGETDGHVLGPLRHQDRRRQSGRHLGRGTAGDPQPEGPEPRARRGGCRARRSR